MARRPPDPPASGHRPGTSVRVDPAGAATAALRRAREHLERVAEHLEDGVARGVQSAIEDVDTALRLLHGLPAAVSDAPRVVHLDPPYDDSLRPADLPAQRLLEDAIALHDRLHRVTVALGITEEFAAEALERLADAGGPDIERHRAEAQRARQSAQACRDLGARLDTIRPYLHLEG